MGKKDLLRGRGWEREDMGKGGDWKGRGVEGVGRGRKMEGKGRRDGGVEDGRVEGWKWAGEGRRWGRERTSCVGDFLGPAPCPTTHGYAFKGSWSSPQICRRSLKQCA